MLQGLQKREEQFLAEVLEQGQREGVLQPQNPQSCARALVAAMQGLELHPRQLGVESKLDASIRELAQLLCDSLRR